MGAVMGSKNLKAIAVRGKDRPEYYDAKGFRDTVKSANASIKENSLGMSLLGTAGGVPNTERYGDLPLRNWRMELGQGPRHQRPTHPGDHLRAPYLLFRLPDRLRQDRQDRRWPVEAHGGMGRSTKPWAASAACCSTPI